MQAIPAPERAPAAQGFFEHAKKEADLAVEIQVPFENLLPRNAEPTLFIDGIPVEGGSRIVKVEDNITVMGFLVKRPELLKEGASLEVRMPDQPSTKATVPGALQRNNIRPLTQDTTRRPNLPSLEKWLERSK
jgi:hypothetical protein